jgi:DNA-directed RNA polymerase specialized sigma24 family protein
MKKAKEQANTYTYKSVDGTMITIRAGENGVTEEMIRILRESDNDMNLQERYQEENESYSYRNAVEHFEKVPNEDEDHPLERIADGRADIMGILFPDRAEDSLLLQKLEKAMEQLTEGQQDLIYELYGFCKNMADIAREQDVTLTAIQNRRNKIFRRLKKLIDEEEG